jgi:negative regulator of PHO system
MGYPLYRGRDNNDQLVQIMKVTGTPSEETWAQIRKDSVGGRGPISFEINPV